MDQINPAGLSSVSTVDPLHKCTLGAADAAAAKTTRLQAKNRPWICSKRKVRVTNAQCRAAYLAGEDRSCVGCSIPNILPKCEDDMKGNCDCCDATNVTLYRRGGVNRCYACHVKLAPAKAEEVSAPDGHGAGNAIEQATREPVQELHSAGNDRGNGRASSWDDFTPLDTKAPMKALVSYAVISRGKLTFSRAAVPSTPFRPGDFVELRYSQDKQALALRKADGPATDSRKMTDDGAHRLNLSISQHIKVWELPSGHFEIEAVPWGVLVHLSKPIAPPTKRGITGQAA